MAGCWACGERALAWAAQHGDGAERAESTATRSRRAGTMLAGEVGRDYDVGAAATPARGGKRGREEGGCARAPCSWRKRTGEEGRGRLGRLSRAPAMASDATPTRQKAMRRVVEREGGASSPRQHGAAARHSERGAAPTAGRGEVVTRSWARKLGNRAEKLCDWRKKLRVGRF
jgi:hypothetical protein